MLDVLRADTSSSDKRVFLIVSPGSAGAGARRTPNDLPRGRLAADHAPADWA
jgi:hypothetical protein